MQRCDKCGCLDLTHCGCGQCDEIDVELAAIGDQLDTLTMTVWKHDVFEAINTIANVIESDLVELDEAITDVACELSNAGINGSHSVNRLKAIYRGMRDRIVSVRTNLGGNRNG
jgi:hypothetical protein